MSQNKSKNEEIKKHKERIDINDQQLSSRDSESYLTITKTIFNQFNNEILE